MAELSNAARRVQRMTASSRPRAPESREAAHDSTTGTGPANADLTNYRFGCESGSLDFDLVCLTISVATAELPEDIATIRAFMASSVALTVIPVGLTQKILQKLVIIDTTRTHCARK